MLQPHWRSFLLRWLRRLGLVSALFVLLLAGTGILLNHGHDLGLDRRPLESRWLRQHYGQQAAAPTAPGLVHSLSAGRLAAEAGHLRLNDRDLGDCARLVGVIEQGQKVLAVCSDRLVLLTPQGELVNQADSLRGVPDGLSAVDTQGERIVLRRGSSSFSVNLGDLSVAPLEVGANLTGPSLPAPAQEGAGGAAFAPPASAANGSVTWERFILDLHSGRLFGWSGVWLMDIMAGLFVVLAVSGLILFRRQHRQGP